MLRGTAGRGKVTVTTYDKKMENFDTMNISNLDTWVFNKVEDSFSLLLFTYLSNFKVEAFFTSARNDPELQRKLAMDGNVFFLHLPSTDGYGSVFKPPSAEYRANINAVDAGVSRTVYCTVLYCTVGAVHILRQHFLGSLDTLGGVVSNGQHLP